MFIYADLAYPVAVFLATLIAMFFSFKTFGNLVFSKNDNHLIFKFAIVTLINYSLSVLIIYIFKEYQYTSYTAGAFATIIVAINSFLLNNYFVFKQ